MGCICDVGFALPGAFTSNHHCPHAAGYCHCEVVIQRLYVTYSCNVCMITCAIKQMLWICLGSHHQRSNVSQNRQASANAADDADASKLILKLWS